MKSSERAALEGKDKVAEYSEPLYPRKTTTMAELSHITINNEGEASDALIKHMIRQPDSHKDKR